MVSRTHHMNPRAGAVPRERCIFHLILGIVCDLHCMCICNTARCLSLLEKCSPVCPSILQALQCPFHSQHAHDIRNPRAVLYGTSARKK